MQNQLQVLIADDRPRTRLGLKALLETFSGVEVVGEARNGRMAVRLVGEIHPEVVVMDARMPLMNGLDATRKIKERWPAVRVVMLTLYTVYRTDARAAGVDAFLLKGCSPESLLAAIAGEDEQSEA